MFLMDMKNFKIFSSLFESLIYQIHQRRAKRRQYKLWKWLLLVWWQLRFLYNRLALFFHCDSHLLTLSALRGGENSPPPYENSLSYFCEWVIFFQLLMTFQFETSNICWLGKIICLTWKKLRNPGSKISSLLIYLSNIQCPKWSANPITVTPIWKWGIV